MLTLPSVMFECYYGAPGSGKSEACARMAETIFRETGKRTRIVVGDGSALTYEHLVEAGVADILDFSTRSWPQATLIQLSKGYWPNAKDDLVPTDAATKATIGLYIFEGLSVAGAYILGLVEGGLAWRAARGEKIGQESPIRIVDGVVDPKTNTVVSGTGMTFGGNPPSHYGVAQRTLQECLNNSKGLKVPVIWTAHEATNNPENDLNKELLVGPEVVGKALTSTIQRSFNNTLHFCTVSKRTKQQDSFTGKAVDDLDVEHRIYTRDHFSAAGASLTRFKACTRGADAQVPQYVTGGAPGMAVLAYYEMLAAMRSARTASLTAATVTTPPSAVTA